MTRDLRPHERRPTTRMLAALRWALVLEQGPQGTPWVVGHGERRGPSRYGRACARRGWATEVYVVPGGTVPCYVLTHAGRALAVEHTVARATRAQFRARPKEAA